MKVTTENVFEIHRHIELFLDINQQIIDAQSAQNLSHSSDHGTHNGIQRQRSSITRTLLMNTGR